MPQIIIVEDDPMISEIYQKKFGEAGFNVLSASSGEEAVALTKKEKADAILMDLIMPKMDGFEAIKKIREGEFGKDIKIFVFSNLSQKEDRDKAAKLGADDFIVKSDFTPTELVKEVQRFLHQVKHEKKNELRDMAKNGNGKKGENLKIENPKKILLIEDEDIFVDMFGKKLRQDGFEVVIAQNGSVGLKEAQSGEYDLIITDMVLPNMNGDEIVAKLKLDDKTKSTPIIVLSASGMDEAVRRVEGMGINAFYVKTQLVPSELSDKIGEVLNLSN
jgi:DNA-binding response OmpR family regulator